MSRQVKRKAEEMASGTGTSGNAQRQAQPPPKARVEKKYRVKFTNHIVAKAASTLVNQLRPLTGKIAMISGFLAPCEDDGGKDTIRLECPICGAKQYYGLVKSASTPSLFKEVSEHANNKRWTQRALRGELKSLGIKCPKCRTPGATPPSPLTQASPKGSDFAKKDSNGFPAKQTPMKHVNQILEAMIPLLKALGASKIALKELEQLKQSDRTSFDMEQLQDLDPDDKVRLHAFSKTLKYSTDAYMRDQDTLSRDEARNKKLVKENDIVLMESSFDVTAGYLAKLRNPIEPHSGICESSRATQKTNKYRPYQVEDIGKETFTAKPMFTFGGDNLEKIAEENRASYMLIGAVDEGVEMPSDPGKIAAQQAKNCFLHAKAETRSYDQPMAAFEVKLSLQSKVISSCYSDILAHEHHTNRMRAWLANGVSQEVLAQCEQDAKAMYARNKQGSQFTEQLFDETSLQYNAEELTEGDEDDESDEVDEGNEAAEEEEEETKHEDTLQVYDANFSTDLERSSTERLESPASKGRRVSNEPENGSATDSGVDFMSSTTPPQRQQTTSPASSLSSMSTPTHHRQKDAQDVDVIEDQPDDRPHKRVKLSSPSHRSTDTGGERCEALSKQSPYTDNNIGEEPNDASQANPVPRQLFCPGTTLSESRPQVSAAQGTNENARIYSGLPSALASAIRRF